MLVWPSKWVKQITEIKQNGVKNPNLLGGKSAGYLQAKRKICTGDYREQIQLAVRAGLELGASELRVQRSTPRPGNWYNTPYSYR